MIPKTARFNYRAAALLTVGLIWQWTIALPLQDIAGGASAFQAQDIMGGAAVIFKRPQRVRDLVGGGALAIVKKSRPPVRRTEEVARVTPPERRHIPGRPAPTPTPAPVISDADKAEAFKNQGNTYYGLGQYAQAVEAYQNALKYTPNDPDIHN